MSFDYYAFLDKDNKTDPKKVDEGDLASGFVDKCTVWSCQEKGNDQNKKKQDPKNEARKDYMEQAKKLKFNLPENLHFGPSHASLPASTWFAIDLSFILKSPWYSKDDRPFHVLDNPVRKDRVLGVPFMSAASWKGLLRWACRMQAGLSRHLETHDMKMNGWKDPSWIVHLFGNENEENDGFRSGALVCYPTWFDKIGFEVINPHCRTSKAGTQPICYEVVPAETKGRLRLLYAPLAQKIENDKVTPANFIAPLLDSIEALLKRYGISAKRTAGWGTALILTEDSKVWSTEGSWLDKLVDKTSETEPYEQPKEHFRDLMDEKGSPIPILLENGTFLSKTKYKKLGETNQPCKTSIFVLFREWYENHGEKYKRGLDVEKEDQQTLNTREFPFDKFMAVVNRLRDAQKESNQ